MPVSGHHKRRKGIEEEEYAGAKGVIQRGQPVAERLPEKSRLRKVALEPGQ